MSRSSQRARRRRPPKHLVHIVPRRIISAAVVFLLFAGLYIVAADNRPEYDYLNIQNGMLEPIIPYSYMRDPAYTNVGSDTIRYCVYVETDHDTDGDGMADLVKAFVQVPYPAVQGKYKAATIYDPTPYAAGTVADEDAESDDIYVEKEFNYDILYDSGQKRTPAGEADTMAAAYAAVPSLDWDYYVPLAEEPAYSFSDDYDYFLVRGYAIVQAAGIGTYGSEGFELCGTDLERDSHKAVVEWLAGNRIAYTNRTDNIAIKADWSNGNVAMTGTSYGGTLPFEVATTGVEGLKTIIPYAGIASWYDYTNSQGVSIITDVHYKDYLSHVNCGGTFKDEDWLVPDDDYGSWLWTVARDETETNGDYAPIWAASDYSKDYEKITCSALIVQGLNDFNVTTRQADLMYRAFSAAKAPVKMILHQDGHKDLYGYRIGEEPWYEIVNRWLAHYLYDVDNGIEDMAPLTVQSNIDGKYVTYDKWRDFTYRNMPVKGSKTNPTITSVGLAEYVQEYALDNYNTLSFEDMEDFFLGLPKENAAVYDIVVPDDCTIKGVPEIHLSASTDKAGYDGLMVSAILIDTDTSGKTFHAFMLKDRLYQTVPRRKAGQLLICDDLMPMDLYEQVPNSTTAKCISFGWFDLANQGQGDDSSSYDTIADLVADQFYDHTIYMLPTVYTVAKGHKLKLVLTTWDPYRAFLKEDFEMELPEGPIESDYDYSYIIDNDALEVNLPVVDNE